VLAKLNFDFKKLVFAFSLSSASTKFSIRCMQLSYKRFQNIHCCKQKRTRATSRVNNGNAVECFVKVFQQFGVVGVFNDILCKLANVQVVGNKIVDG
jgi:hypothetical protein